MKLSTGRVKPFGEVVWFDTDSELRQLGATAAAITPNREYKLLAPNFACAIALSIKELNEQHGLPVWMFEGLRTAARQEWLYAQGRTRSGSIVTNARSAAYSWHGHGLGADVAFRNKDDRWYWPTERKLWQKVYDVVARYDCITGIDWRFQDMPHVQPQNLKTSPSAFGRSLLASGGPEAVWRETRHDRPRILDELGEGLLGL